MTQRIIRMRIIFIRHGNPDYAQDCLTELGHMQAEAAAEELCTMGIERIYSSSHGRAVQTAEHTAKRLGLEITQCDFIRELTARLKADPTAPWSRELSPWLRTLEYTRRGLPLLDKNWRYNELYSDIDTPECIDKLCADLDEWLLSLGVERDGIYYRVNNPKHEIVAMFCHAMAYSAALAHVFNLTFPFVCICMSMPQSGISVVEFQNADSGFAIPRLLKCGNVDHLIKNKIEIT